MALSAHRPRLTAAGAAVTAVLALGGNVVSTAPRAEAAAGTSVQVGPTSAGVRGLLDAAGREVVLRGFNVTSSTKLSESGHRAFRSTADAAASAQAIRDLTGANVVRFLVSWEAVQPTPTSIDTTYLADVASQVKAFTDRGIRVFLDWHQDLYSAHLFTPASWYSGNGAPRWVVDAGHYPPESCGVCVSWGQNALSNAAVKQAFTDLWTNARLTTPHGVVGVQDAYLTQLRETLTYLSAHLPASSLAMVIGVDPFNEPSPGTLDPARFEPDFLMPFYRRARLAMDQAGWTDKVAMVEPNVFWNNGFQESGGFDAVAPFDDRYLFNTHLYDGLRFIINPFAAADGEYVTPVRRVRQRGTGLTSEPFVTEFGNAVSGSISAGVTPTVVRAWYQAFDHGLKGSTFWADAKNAGTPLSATQWQWDPYNGRHREPYNGDPNRVVTAGDAFNGEDFSVVRTDDAGVLRLRLDRRLLDRVYPSATAGHRLAFAYEDRARPDLAATGSVTAWTTVPATLPTLRTLVTGQQYAVLVWREAGNPSGAPTELHLPENFRPGSTTVVSDLGSAATLAAPTARFRVAAEDGSTVAQKLVVDATGSAAGTVHVVLVANLSGRATPSAATLAAVRSELTGWTAANWP